MMQPARGRWLHTPWATAGLAIGMALALPLGTDAQPAVPPSAPTAAEASAQRVRLVCLTQELKFDLDEFTVTAGEPVELTLVNPSDMPHNLVGCTPGEEVHMNVAMQAWSLPDALERQYVPESPLVLFHTRLLNPGEEDTIHFEAPEEPGAYPYVCTVPGHAMTMWGIMHVVAAGQAAPAAHDHGGHATVEPHAYLSNVTYQYFEGDYQRLPDFASMAPLHAGVIQSGRLDLPKTPKEQFFGVVIKATLEAPQEGKYVFGIRCDDGGRLRIDGKNAVNHDGRHPASFRVGRPVPLAKGPHVVEVAYFNAAAEAALQLVWSGPGLNEMEPLSTAVDGIDLNRFFLEVGDEPIVQRGLMEDSSPRSIAVGLPGGTSYCFDAEKGFVRYGWTGHFIDVGPQHGYGDGRGGSTLIVLGETFDVGAKENPLRLGTADKLPPVEFLGYERAGAAPKMLYSVDGVKVSQVIEAVANERGLRFTYEFESTPPAPVFFVAEADGLELASSAGEWTGGQLQLDPEAARRFSVTVIDRR